MNNITKGNLTMNPKERFIQEATEAVNQLVQKTLTLNAEQIAELEVKFFAMGMTKLAGFIRTQGLNNAGDDYNNEYTSALRRYYIGQTE